MRILLSFLLTLAWCAGVVAQTAAPARPAPSFALRAGRLFTSASQGPFAIENAVVIVRDGKIIAVGRDLQVPPDLELIDLPNATVMPGIVAAVGASLNSAGEESVRAGYRAVDEFNTYADTRETLEAGVTTVHLSPGWNRLVSGRGAVVRLAGPSESRVLIADADLTVNLGDAALNPPALVEQLVPPSSDNAIKPAQAQRPASRIGQYLALKESIEAATAAAPSARLTMHLAALGDAWRSTIPVRIQAQRSADIAGALSFLSSSKKSGYLVGGFEAAKVADQLATANVPLVYTISAPMRAPGRNLGPDPLAPHSDPRDLAAMARVRLALATAPDQPASDLRLVAATALRAGLSHQRIIEGITRIPAEILGVGNRVGSIEAGRDADFLVLSGDPLATATHVERVYVAGHLAFTPSMRLPAADRAAGRETPHATIVRGGTIWLGPNQYLENGAVLIEDGKITQVGKAVSTPVGARVIDAGPDAFITPGFIDAYSHLGFEGDQNSTGVETSLSRMIGVADEPELRVARAGVTTVMMSPYRPGGSGSQITAVKTAGADRGQRVVAPTSGVVFDITDSDPVTIGDRFKPRFEAAKRYVETWKKYETDLAEWEKKRAAGQVVETKPKVVEDTAAAPKNDDPLTGTWTARVFGGPIPPSDEREGKVAFKLTGNKFEGRITDPPTPMPVKFTGELDGKKITGKIEVETRGLGYPTFEGNIDPEDHITGTITFQGLNVNFEMRRVDKSEVEFKVQSNRKRRTTGKDGRPLPPKVDEGMEPFRAALEKRIPVVVIAATPTQIDVALDVLVDLYDVPVILLNAEGARVFADRLASKNVGVIPPPQVMRREKYTWYAQHDDLSRKGVRVAFQSNAEDAARSLPTVALYAVERGLSPETALAALTIDAARMFKLENRIGAIAPGHEGDLVVFSGHPFQTGSAVTHVIISGEEVAP